MSNLMGDAIAQNVHKQNIMKDAFGWDIPVESIPVPSAGLLYDPDSKLYKTETLQIKAMTAHEEDILTSPALLKEGTAVDYVIKSCLIDKTINVDNLIVGDKNAIMVSIRVTGYGRDYNIKPACDNCNKINEITCDLSNLSIDRLKIEPIAPGRNEFEFILPVTKKRVVFKFMTVKDQKEREAKQKFYEKKVTSGIRNTVTGFLEYSILAIEGITDKNKIHHFIRNMPAYDSKALRKHIIDNEPGIDMSHEWECNYCQHENDSVLLMTAEFFWPRI